MSYVTKTSVLKEYEPHQKGVLNPTPSRDSSVSIMRLENPG